LSGGRSEGHSYTLAVAAACNCDAVGIDNMMCSTDSPHQICDWPYSRKLANQMSAGVRETERHQSCAGSVAALYTLQ
jgi:hypothetical protein